MVDDADICQGCGREIVLGGVVHAEPGEEPRKFHGMGCLAKYQARKRDANAPLPEPPPVR